MRRSFFKTIQTVRGPLAVLLATGLLFAWLTGGPASAEMLFQSRPNRPLIPPPPPQRRSPRRPLNRQRRNLLRQK